MAGMTVAEAANALEIRTLEFVYRCIHAGTLRAEKKDGRWDIDPASVRAYLDRRESRRRPLRQRRPAVDELLMRSKEIQL
jgi:excisionase family DNA binding protein